MEKFFKNNFFCLYQEKEWIMGVGVLTGYQEKE